MARQWMPFYVGDYMRDTAHLTLRQHGTYLKLICHYWSTGGLPTNDAQLRIITGSTLKAWRVDKPVVQALFHSGWHHKRLDEELIRSVEAAEKRRLAGSKGGTMSYINRHRRR